VQAWARGRQTPGLAIARAFGDTDAARIGCSSTPEFAAFSLRPTDEFLILASDGLWETFTHTEAVRWVEQYTLHHQVRYMAVCVRGG